MTDSVEAKLDELLQRLGALEKQVENLQGRIPVADEETIMAITAACCAYMGVKGKVRAIRYANSSGRRQMVTRH